MDRTPCRTHAPPNGPPTLSPVVSLAADARPLPLSAKLLYGVGEMPITVLMVLSGLFMLFFYNSVMGLPSALVGIGLASSLVVDALLDPYIGHISDRTSHRFGRRHIFMLPGALVMGPCFFLLFSPPRSLGHSRTICLAAGVVHGLARLQRGLPDSLSQPGR